MKKYYDTIVIGTGLAGLYTCLNLDPSKQVLLISKEAVLRSDSYLAQGGIATMHDDSDFDSYYDDTMRAGRFENSPAAVCEMINQSRSVVCDLISKGVCFDRRDGDLEYTREGGHSIFRILHHKDITGKEITTKLFERVSELDNVTVIEHTMLMDLTENKGSCCGVALRLESGEVKLVGARDVVLATGGLGGLFKNSTNFSHITGDAISIAIGHGVELANIDYIQIHPTVLSLKTKGRRYLISESVRGEGATLHNEVGERFIDELLPRDIVAAAIHEQMKKYGTEHVYLDVSAIDNKKLKEHFPNICERCLAEGIDVDSMRIPVVPAPHYLMGGIKADINGKTSMPHLFAVGECAGNGVHGANRLASNSLLESLAFSRNCAKQINFNDSDEKLAIISKIKDEYKDLTSWYDNSRHLIMSEIKKNNEVFYDKWCYNEDNS